MATEEYSSGLSRQQLGELFAGPVTGIGRRERMNAGYYICVFFFLWQQCVWCRVWLTVMQSVGVLQWFVMRKWKDEWVLLEMKSSNRNCKDFTFYTRHMHTNHFYGPRFMCLCEREFSRVYMFVKDSQRLPSQPNATQTDVDRGRGKEKVGPSCHDDPISFAVEAFVSWVLSAFLPAW